MRPLVLQARLPELIRQSVLEDGVFKSGDTGRVARFSSLSREAQEIGEPVVPVVQPVGRSMALLALLARVDLLLGRHVLLAAYAKVALDGAAAHRAPVELAEAGGADAGVSAGQERARQRKVLAHDAQLLARAVPQRTAVLVATLTGRHQGAASTATAAAAAASSVVVVARLGERQRGRRVAESPGRHVALVVVAGVARRQVQLLWTRIARGARLARVADTFAPPPIQRRPPRSIGARCRSLFSCEGYIYIYTLRYIYISCFLASEIYRTHKRVYVYIYI